MATPMPSISGRRVSSCRKATAWILVAGWLALGAWAVMVGLDARRRAEPERSLRDRIGEDHLFRTSCGGITSSECPAVSSDDAEAQSCYTGQIKGNARSMIYHVPGASQYARTKADVRCFSDEDGARLAGFRPARGTPARPPAAAEPDEMVRPEASWFEWFAAIPAPFMVLATVLAWLRLSLGWKSGAFDLTAQELAWSALARLRTFALGLLYCLFVLAMMPVLALFVATPFGVISVLVEIASALGLPATLTILAGVALCFLGLVTYAWWVRSGTARTHAWGAGGRCMRCGMRDVVPDCLDNHGPAYDVDAMEEDNPYGIVPHCVNEPCRPSRRVDRLWASVEGTTRTGTCADGKRSDVGRAHGT